MAMMSVNVPPISVPTSHSLSEPFISFLVQPLLSFSAHRTRPGARTEATLLRAAEIAKGAPALKKPAAIAVVIRHHHGIPCATPAAAPTPRDCPEHRARRRRDEVKATVTARDSRLVARVRQATVARMRFVLVIVGVSA
jgi:hypothetical protein